MELTAANVHTIMMDSLYTNEEADAEHLPPDTVIVEGIVHRFGFHPERLARHREDVRSILREVHPTFISEGWSFLNLTRRADGELWGEQVDAEALMALGLALGLIIMQVPQRLWGILPGGVPYIRVTLDA